MQNKYLQETVIMLMDACLLHLVIMLMDALLCLFPFVRAPSNTYAASNLLSGSNLDTMINQLMEMGGGSWDRDKVQQALRAAYNNPERAVDYLYSVCICFAPSCF
jgi:hypothetical protein